MKVITCLAVFTASLLLASAAYALGGGGGAREACKNDAQTYCKDVQPGGGRIINCLEDHYKDVSDECYKVLKKAEDRRSKKGGDAPPPTPGGQGDSGDMPPPEH